LKHQTWLFILILFLFLGILIMNADQILNNTDPEELRNLLWRLRQQQEGVTLPPPTVIVNSAPGQFPSVSSSAQSLQQVPIDPNLSMDDGDMLVYDEDQNLIVADHPIDFERYLAVYNTFIGSGTIGYHIGLATSHNGRDWVIRDEPVIPFGSSGAWDDFNHQFPQLLQVDGVLYLYYAGAPGSGWTAFKIGLARSFDGGVTWEKYASNPILDNNIAWENSQIFAPVVLYDREETDATRRWKMWYGGSSFGQGIGYAYSSDGLTWTKYASNPVLSLGAGGQWDDVYVYPGAVIRRGNEFILFYGGYDGAAWATGCATFTNPEGTYTKSTSNPIIAGDGITTTLTANLTAGSTTATVTSATAFPIGCPIWIGPEGNRYLTHVTRRNSSTSLELADAAPTTISSGGNVRSIAHGSVGITNAYYDDGYKFLIVAHKPDGASETGVHELSLLGYANDELVHAYIDYGAGVLFAVTVAESQSQHVTRENPSMVDTYDQDAKRHKPGTIFDADRDGVVDNSELLEGHPASYFMLSTADYDDISANDADTDVTGAELEELTDGSETALHSHASSGGSGSGGNHLHGLARWLSSGGTTFDLPDIAEYVESVALNGLEEDPTLYSLSSDRTQIVFDSATTAADVVTAHYVLAQV
jgi:predicted GH43/DUF377 family glycosyl hydrolase